MADVSFILLIFFLVTTSMDSNKGLQRRLPQPDYLGEVETTKAHVISLQNDVDTQYQTYIEVQNELIAAYNELRNEFAQNRFGRKYEDLPVELQKSIQKVYPQNISEAEPKNYGGN